MHSIETEGGCSQAAESKSPQSAMRLTAPPEGEQLGGYRSRLYRHSRLSSSPFTIPSMRAQRSSPQRR